MRFIYYLLFFIALACASVIDRGIFIRRTCRAFWYDGLIRVISVASG